MILKAIMLAAGGGARFGGCKLTAPLDGQPLMARALEGALAAPVDQVVLVTGLHGEAVEACAHALQPGAIADGRLRLVHAPDAAQGMGASLRAGMAGIGWADGVFVFLADMPAIPRDLPGLLAQRLAQGAEAVAPAWRGRRGHPVLFGRALFPDLRAFRGDEGARGLLAGLGPRLALIDVSDDGGILLDVDTAQDLQRARDQIAGLRLSEHPQSAPGARSDLGMVAQVLPCSASGTSSSGL